ncbi:MAG: hypothetical protein ABR973_10625 [Candidatus Acidiferrales bacterium]
MDGFRLVLSAGMPVIALALVAAANQKVRIAPRFLPGATLYYQIESRTTTTGKTTTPIANPEGGSKASQVIDLLVRIDVLDAPPPSAAVPGAVRLRATYEKSQAQSESDAFDPEGSWLEDQYRRIQGRSIEFTIEPGGQLADFKGLDQLLSDPSAAAPAVSWLDVLSSGSAFPKNGISIGQKWRGERPIPDTPLSGLTWLTESTYLRDEPCDSRGSATRAGANADVCAVILTRFEISSRGSPHSDATPDDYRRNGLRTSGTWTGSGESLDSISLADGLLVSSTQTSTQDMDYEIVSASTGSSIHRTGRIQSQSIITLVPPPAAAQP